MLQIFVSIERVPDLGPIDLQIGGGGLLAQSSGPVLLEQPRSEDIVSKLVKGLTIALTDVLASSRSVLV